MDLVTILPNLAIGVVAILALGYVSKEFIMHLRIIHSEHKQQLSELHSQHLRELKEREVAMREVEKEVRTNISSQLSENTHAMREVIAFIKK